MTVDDLIAIRLKTWFPTIDIGTAVDIAKVRKDLEAFAADLKADLLAEGQKTRDTLLAELEKLPRYEPEARQGRQDDDAMARVLAVLAGPEKPGAGFEVEAADIMSSLGLEVAMRAVPAGEAASFVAIQDIRRVLK